MDPLQKFQEVIKVALAEFRISLSAIDSYSIEPLSVLHSKLEFEW